MHVDERVLSCDAELADGLETQCNAYTARRGPVGYERNALELGYLLAGGKQPAVSDEAVTGTVAEVLDCAWVLEDADLEDVSEARR